ncbi:hypothetical protein TNCV_4064011 [Trichonephila clavipes]|nr:hypothetical protein TNCV_4064011 [Trichonephila clavipes]
MFRSPNHKPIGARRRDRSILRRADSLEKDFKDLKVTNFGELLSSGDWNGRVEGLSPPRAAMSIEEENKSITEANPLLFYTCVSNRIRI